MSDTWKGQIQVIRKENKYVSEESKRKPLVVTFTTPNPDPKKDLFYELWKGNIKTIRKTPIDFTEESKISTKSCPLCGNTQLLLTSTLNLKTCTDCTQDIPWYKETNQINYI